MVLDEVKVGRGRSGKLFAYQHDDLAPDMTVFGKGLGGGLPISAIVGPAAILDHAPAFAMQTTAGNPVCTAVGKALLDTIINEGLPAHALTMGAKIRACFTKLAEQHEIIGDVRRRGLAIGIDLVASRETRAQVSATTTAKVTYRAYELGANFLYVGLAANVLEITPPLNVSAAEIEEGLDIIDRALADVARGVVSDESVQAFMNW